MGRDRSRRVAIYSLATSPVTDSRKVARSDLVFQISAQGAQTRAEHSCCCIARWQRRVLRRKKTDMNMSKNTLEFTWKGSACNRRIFGYGIGDR